MVNVLENCFFDKIKCGLSMNMKCACFFHDPKKVVIGFKVVC